MLSADFNQDCFCFSKNSFRNTIRLSNSLDPHQQGSHGQGKVREKLYFFKVREKSGNCLIGQGNLKLGKSQGKVREI